MQCRQRERLQKRLNIGFAFQSSNNIGRFERVSFHFWNWWEFQWKSRSIWLFALNWAALWWTNKKGTHPNWHYMSIFLRNSLHMLNIVRRMLKYLKWSNCFGWYLKFIIVRKGKCRKDVVMHHSVNCVFVFRFLSFS